MKQSKINQLRNLAHPIGMIIVFYTIGQEIGLSFDMYVPDSLSRTITNMVLVSIVGGGVGAGVLGALYELYKLCAFGHEASWSDVIRSSIGGVLGFGLACLFPNLSKGISDYLMYGFVGLGLIADTVFAIYKNRQAKK